MIFFHIDASPEQLLYAIKLVDYSIAHHKVKDIFADDPDGVKRQREFRFIGTLGEVLFADAYGLPRPTRSFGAEDGQDHGVDFSMMIDGKMSYIDVKSMRRKSNNFMSHYALNLPVYQMERNTIHTDYYFCISIHKQDERYIASFIGYVSKHDIEYGYTGTIYKAGQSRQRQDGTMFTLNRDICEVTFGDISPPKITDTIKQMSGFNIKQIITHAPTTNHHIRICRNHRKLLGSALR